MDADRLFARPMEPGDMDLLADWLIEIEDLALFDRTQTVPLSRAAVREIWSAEFAVVKPPTAFWFVPVALGGLHSVNYVMATPPSLSSSPRRRAAGVSGCAPLACSSMWHLIVCGSAG